MRTLLILVALTGLSAQSIEQAVVVQEATDQARLKKAQEEIDRLTALHEADVQEKITQKAKAAGQRVAQQTQKVMVSDTNDAVHSLQEEAKITASKLEAQIRLGQIEVDKYAYQAKIAEENAKTERAKADAERDKQKGNGISAMLQGIFYTIGICAVPFMTFWFKRIQDKQKVVTETVLVKLGEVHDAAQAAVASGLETKDKMGQLERQTNSIKDALVKSVGEAEFAKGLLKGTEGAKT